MKKKTLGIILNVFIVLLVLMNTMLVIMILKRGSEPIREEEEKQNETPVVVEAEDVTPTPTPVPEEELPEAVKELIAIPTTKVNVRSEASTDGDKLGSAYETDELNVVEIGDSWTKLIYEDKEAYINNKYLTFRYRITEGNGQVSYEDTTAEDAREAE